MTFGLRSGCLPRAGGKKACLPKNTYENHEKRRGINGSGENVITVTV